MDNTAPTVTISGVPSASAGPFTATFTFLEGVSGFTRADIAVSNGTAGIVMGADGGMTYTARISPVATGMVTVDVAAGAARDAAGNGNTAAAQAVSLYTAPAAPAVCNTADVNEIWCTTMTVGTATGLIGFLSGTGSLVKDNFEDISGAIYTVERLYSNSSTFTVLGIQAGGVNVTLPDDDNVTLQLENKASPGTYWEFDLEDDTYSTSTSTYGISGGSASMLPSGHVAGDMVTVKLIRTPPAESTAPTVTSIMRQDPATTPTNANELTWRVTFSEYVKDVDGTDFEVSNTTAMLSAAVMSASGTVYDVTASGGDLTDVTDTVTLSFATGQDIEDLAGNALSTAAAPSSNDNTYMVDHTAPTVTITGVPATSDGPFPATFAFSEAVVGFTLNDIIVGNGTAATLTGGDTVFMAQITPTANGSVTVDVAAGAAADAVGNPNPAAVQVSSAYSACTTPDLGTRRQLWTATLEPLAGIGTNKRGYHRHVNPGALSDLAFALGVNTYTVEALFGYSPSHGSVPGDVEFNLDKPLKAHERTALRLHVCADLSLNFSSARHDSTIHAYEFTAATDWSSENSLNFWLSLPANNDATGAPSVSGTGAALVGQTLTAAQGTMADTDGLPSAFTYRWIRVDSGDETAIAGATSSTYTLADADAGKTVRVEVSFIDKLNGEESRRSAIYPETGNILAMAPAPSACDPSDSNEIWCAVLTVGEVPLSALGFYTNVGSLDDDDFDIGTATYTVESLYSDSKSMTNIQFQVGGTNTDLPDEDDVVLQMENRAGPGTYWEFDFEDDTYSFSTLYAISGGSASMLPSGHVAGDMVRVKLIRRTVAAVPMAPTELAATKGNAEVSLVWTAGADGGSAITAHQYRKKVGSGDYEATWTPIPNSEAGGANANSYTVTTGLTNGTAYTFQVRAVNAVGNGAEATSDEVTPSVANTPATGAPAITGTRDRWARR